jgi:hypothetical protein
MFTSFIAEVRTVQKNVMPLCKQTTVSPCTIREWMYIGEHITVGYGSVIPEIKISV